MSVVDSTLPAFEAGTYLILFLKRAAQDYEIVGGPYGVFREEDGHVRSLLTVDTRMKEKYDGLDVTAFRNAVSGALRK